MANSLIELYGGGMAGKSNNYQLGGRIASARRGREYQKEMRQLREKAEAAARRKRKSGFLGSLGSIAGGALGAALAPITGGASIAIGAGLGKALGESTYAREGYGGGKYAKETRGDLRDVEDEYRRGIGERALVTGLQAAIMPGIYEKGGEWLKGTKLGQMAGAKFGSVGSLPAPGAPEELLSPSVGALGETSLPFSMADPSSAVSAAMPSTTVAAAATPPLPPSIPQEMALPSMYGDMALADIPLSEGFDLAQLGMGQQSPSFDFASFLNPAAAESTGYNPIIDFNPYLNRKGGGWIPKMQAGGRALAEEMMNPTMGANLGRSDRPQIGMPSAPSPIPAKGREGIVPKPEGFPAPTSPIASSMTPTVGANLGQIDSVAGQDLTPDLSGTDFSALQGLSGSDMVFGGDPIFGSDTDWSMTGSNLFGLKGAGATVTSPTGGTTPSAPIGGAYGTAIGAQSALHQMGMGDVADDPRLQKYLEDLPQFSQGYRQQFGDIHRGGRQALQQMYAAQRLGGGAAGGFAGAGAGGQAFQQQLGGLRSDIGRQRRGVVEGFQSDLLSAIGDIEAKGEFEFGAEEASSKLAKAQQLAEQGGLKGMTGRLALKKLAAQGIVPQANQGNVANPTQLDTFQDTQDMDAYYGQQYG